MINTKEEALRAIHAKCECHIEHETSHTSFGEHKYAHAFAEWLAEGWDEEYTRDIIGRFSNIVGDPMAVGDPDESYFKPRWKKLKIDALWEYVEPNKLVEMALGDFYMAPGTTDFIEPRAYGDGIVLGIFPLMEIRIDLSDLEIAEDIRRQLPPSFRVSYSSAGCAGLHRPGRVYIDEDTKDRAYYPTDAAWCAVANVKALNRKIEQYFRDQKETDR